MMKNLKIPREITALVIRLTFWEYNISLDRGNAFIDVCAEAKRFIFLFLNEKHSIDKRDNRKRNQSTFLSHSGGGKIL